MPHLRPCAGITGFAHTEVTQGLASPLLHLPQTCDLHHKGSILRPLSTANFQTLSPQWLPHHDSSRMSWTPAYPSKGCACRGASSGLGEGTGLQVSTDPAPALLFSKHSARISIRLPETLRCPHRRHDRDGEGSQLVEVTALCQESVLGHKWKAVFSEQNQEAFSFYCLLYKRGTQASDKNIFHFQGLIYRQGLPWVPREL